MGEVHFEPEPYAALCFEAMVAALVKGVRPPERQKRLEKLRQRLLAETELNSVEVESRLAQLPLLPDWEWWQQTWDQMFMIDLWPENKERFGIDARDITERISRLADKLT